MYCYVNCVFKIHKCGWSIIDLRWPNIIEEGGSFHIIDAGEFAQEHGKGIHKDQLKLYDPKDAYSCTLVTDIYMIIKMMDEMDDLWRSNGNAVDFYNKLKDCYRNNSLESILDHVFLSKPT